MITRDVIVSELSAIDADLSAQRAQRATLALSALNADQSAVKAITDLDKQIAAATARRQTLNDGLDGLAAIEAKQRADSKRAEQLAKAERIEAAIAVREKAAGDADDAMRIFVAQLLAWVESDSALQSAGVAARGRAHKAIAGAFWNHLFSSWPAEAYNSWMAELTAAIPLNGQGAGARRFTEDPGIWSARQLIESLRKDAE